MRIIPALALALFGAQAVAAHAGTLDETRARGTLRCGVSPGVPGFSLPDPRGNWTGLDVDVCKAVAAAIFNDVGKIEFTPLNPKDRFPALTSGQVDILARQTTWTLSRETTVRLDFTAVNYYDGQGLMARKALNVTSAKDLGGASVCIQTGSTTELNLADYFRSNGLKYEPVSFNSGDEAISAFESGRCDVFTTDASALFAYRLKMADPGSVVILPEIISKEPLSPAVRKGDQQWTDVVRWVQFAMVNAEELGITSKNVDEQLKSSNPQVRRLLGTDDNLGAGLGLAKDWVYRIIKSVGNYGEVYERNFGENSALKIPRALNNLWTKGGLMYAPPVR